MSVSKTVREALTSSGKRQQDLAAFFGSSVQTMSNKFRLERWTGEELTRVAAFTGGKLAFVYPDGKQIVFDPPAEEPE